MGDDKSQTMKRVTGLNLRLGGEEHSGWLPPGAAKPLPTPVRDVLVDVSIEFLDGAYYLVCDAQDESFCWDTWHESLASAEIAAQEEYGITPEDWENPISN